MMTATTLLKNTFVFFGLFLLFTPISAAVINVNSSGNWSDSSTWDTGTSPSTEDDVTMNEGTSLTIQNGTIAQVKNFATAANTIITIEENASLTVTGLNLAINTQVNVYGSLTVNGNLAAVGQLTLIVNGNVLITGNLSMENNGTLTINTGGVFTVGGNLSGHHDLSITVDGDLDVGGNLSGLDDLSLEVVGNIEVTGNVSGNFDFTLIVNGTGTINGNLSGLAGSTATGTGNLNVTGSVSGPPAFTGATILPVTLRFFKGASHSEGVLLNWASAAEINNDYYTVERSTDGIQFRILTKVKGAGNSFEPLDYQYLDQFPLARAYYRLSQTDFDGTKTVFTTIEITHRQSDEVQLFPTIIEDGTFQLSINENSKATDLVLFGQDARVYLRTQLRPGVQSINLPRHLASGTYIVQVLSGLELLKTERIILK